jgi:signal transduction histidine kinase
VIGDLFRPWRTARTWWTVVHLVLGVVTSSVLFTVAVTLATTAASLIVVLPVGIALAVATLWLNQRFVRVDRSRYAALLDVELPEAPAAIDRQGSLWARTRAMLTNADRWREIAWSTLHFPLAVVAGAVVPAVWGSALALVSTPAWIVLAPNDRIAQGGITVHSGAESFAVAGVGLVLLALVAPWITVALGSADVAMARWLLGRPRSELVAEVATLATSRAAAVDSAEAERRRIERDLHDGAQQRLIAVAMDLGLAREKLNSDPARAGEYVASAHEDVKAALKELRDLVRGIHPVILEDRGLDAALSAVVARAAVPVTLRVDVAQRPAPAVESAAYFIVSESLVNVDRHAHATRATVEIARVADRLTIAVSDDGVGGAESSKGTGLAGLAERVAGLGGWMRVISPQGGPTSILVELPCES